MLSIQRQGSLREYFFRAGGSLVTGLQSIIYTPPLVSLRMNKPRSVTEKMQNIYIHIDICVQPVYSSQRLRQAFLSDDGCHDRAAAEKRP